MSRSSAHPGSKALQVSATPSQSVGLSTDVHNSVDIALSTTDPSCTSGRFRRAMPPCLSVAPALTTLPASAAQRVSHRFTGNDDAHRGAEASLSRAPPGPHSQRPHSSPITVVISSFTANLPGHYVRTLFVLSAADGVGGEFFGVRFP